MQLGSRWPVGQAPHPGVPGILHDAIAAAEKEFSAAHSWTLTWLEGRPRVELFDASAALLQDIGVDPQGRVVVASSRDTDEGELVDEYDDDSDDDWLS